VFDYEFGSGAQPCIINNERITAAADVLTGFWSPQNPGTRSPARARPRRKTEHALGTAHVLVTNLQDPSIRIPEACPTKLGSANEGVLGHQTLYPGNLYVGAFYGGILHYDIASMRIQFQITIFGTCAFDGLDHGRAAA